MALRTCAPQELRTVGSAPGFMSTRSLTGKGRKQQEIFQLPSQGAECGQHRPTLALYRHGDVARCRPSPPSEGCTSAAVERVRDARRVIRRHAFSGCMRTVGGKGEGRTARQRGIYLVENSLHWVFKFVSQSGRQPEARGSAAEPVDVRHEFEQFAARRRGGLDRGATQYNGRPAPPPPHG